jgi:sortase A
MRRTLRITGSLMMVAGVCSIAWAVLVWQWQDPFTAVYAKYEQHKLASRFSHSFADYRPPSVPAPAPAKHESGLAAEMAKIKADATAYRLALKEGEPVGRMIVPRFGLKSIVINGTAHDDLTKGPGREMSTYMPGEGELVYVAGHRTTYLAPFAHIERMRAGDPITLEVPYGTFRYRVFRHRIVGADDVAVLHSRGREIVELQACHPRFFASHRYIVYGRLMQIDPQGAPPIRAPSRTLAAAPLASARG